MKSKNNARRRALIVNADDFGLSPGVNAGVAKAYDHGILTSATLLANAPHFADAVRLAADRPGLGVGVHLNLVRGKPLSAPQTVPRLVDENGAFRRFRLGRLTDEFLRQAEREYRLQFESVLAAGVAPTHFDFEKHHAWQGPLYQLACRLAADYGVKAARLLREPVAWTGRALGWPSAKRTAMAAVLRCGFDFGGGARFAPAHPDRLLGQLHIGEMTEALWLRLALDAPHGVSEVMTHPGERESAAAPEGMGESWLSENRAAELHGLLSPKVKTALAEQDIELITFRDLATPL